MLKGKLFVLISLVSVLLFGFIVQPASADPIVAGILRGVSPDGTNITVFTDGLDSTRLSMPNAGDSYTWTLQNPVDVSEYYFVATSVIHLFFYDSEDVLLNKITTAHGAGVSGTVFIQTNISGVKKIVALSEAAQSGSTYALSELDVKATNTSIPPQQPVESTRALLTIYLASGLIKEYDLPISTVDNFINWYNSRSDGQTSPASYQFIREFNKAKFSKRSDYIPFNKIELFEVDEYEN